MAWSGSKKGLEEKARLRRKAKELALRTKAPYSNRGYWINFVALHNLWVHHRTCTYRSHSIKIWSWFSCSSNIHFLVCDSIAATSVWSSIEVEGSCVTLSPFSSTAAPLFLPLLLSSSSPHTCTLATECIYLNLFTFLPVQVPGTVYGNVDLQVPVLYRTVHTAVKAKMINLDEQRVSWSNQPPVKTVAPYNHEPKMINNCWGWRYKLQSLGVDQWSMQQNVITDQFYGHT